MEEGIMHREITASDRTSIHDAIQKHLHSAEITGSDVRFGMDRHGEDILVVDVYHDEYVSILERAGVEYEVWKSVNGLCDDRYPVVNFHRGASNDRSGDAHQSG